MYNSKKVIDYHGRVCTGCEKYKKWEHFHKDKHSKTGYLARCSECYSKKIPSTVPKRNVKKYELEGFSQAVQNFCLGIKKAAR